MTLSDICGCVLVAVTGGGGGYIGGDVTRNWSPTPSEMYSLSTSTTLYTNEVTDILLDMEAPKRSSHNKRARDLTQKRCGGGGCVIFLFSPKGGGSKLSEISQMIFTDGPLPRGRNEILGAPPGVAEGRCRQRRQTPLEQLPLRRSAAARPGGVAVHREETVVAPVAVPAVAGLRAALDRERAERLPRPDAAAAVAAAAAVGEEAIGVAGVARRRRLGRHSTVACQKESFGQVKYAPFGQVVLNMLQQYQLIKLTFNGSRR